MAIEKFAKPHYGAKEVSYKLQDGDIEPVTDLISDPPDGWTVDVKVYTPNLVEIITNRPNNGSASGFYLGEAINGRSDLRHSNYFGYRHGLRWVAGAEPVLGEAEIRILERRKYFGQKINLPEEPEGAQSLSDVKD